MYVICNNKWLFVNVYFQGPQDLLWNKNTQTDCPDHPWAEENGLQGSQVSSAGERDATAVDCFFLSVHELNFLKLNINVF